MKRLLKKALFLLLAVALPLTPARAREENPQAVTDLLQRVTNAADKFITVLDESLATNSSEEVFVITSQDGKPCIQGSTLPALTTGINWYLNHHAHINLAWNCLTTDLSQATLPVPAGEERHECKVDWRYYLNYCTYSYSCAMWTEERWMQEIDWMALHGINMPLMLVGLDVIWHDIYTSPEFGYTTAELGKYVAGPAFQAWWGMTNLEGHGGPNPEWWYERQRAMCQHMVARMRELGMEPVLPGFYGTVPSNLATKMAGTDGYTEVNSGGRWQGYNAPGMLSATDSKFQHLAQVFYEKQKAVMGTSRFYSMDLCHEGGTAPNCGRPTQAKGIIEALDKNIGTESVWVIQAWQNNPANDLLNAVAKGRLMVLDLFAENTPRWGRFGQHDFVYCMLLNFGGRTGLHGRFNQLVDNYKNVLAQKPGQLKGIGATPEGIETSSVMYDALFELPWTDVDKATWPDEYATARYGQENTTAQAAMQKLMGSVYNCPGGQQGTSEPVILAQPSLTVGSVSTWSTSAIPYDHRLVIEAAADLLSQADVLQGNNFEYDLLDVTRQAISDYASFLLKQINADYQKGGATNPDFLIRKDCYLQLIDDLDELLGSHHSYRFGNWTEMARAIVDEPAAKAAGAGTKDADWLECDNLRRQVSTWSDFNSALREYSNREWNGMLRDYYKPRWVEFFNALVSGTGTGSLNTGYWYNKGCEWIKNTAITYTGTPEGNTKELAAEKFANYFLPLTTDNGTRIFVQRHIEQEFTADEYKTHAFRNQDYTFPVPAGVTATLAVDINNDGNITADEQSATNTIAIPADAATSNVRATATLSDGTVIAFRLALMDEIKADRTVSVTLAEGNEGRGTVGIEGAEGTSVTNKEAVTVKATPASGFDFSGWTMTSGGQTTEAGSENPLVYYGAAEATFAARFVENLWGIPEEGATGDLGDVKKYNQYLSAITCTQGENTADIYTAEQCPDKYFNPVAANISAARGSKFTLQMTDAGGMSYCYLSAYIDLNRDGDFDDEGELLEVRGTKGSQTAGICNKALEVLLPYNMPAGLTHLRLRFDGAWTTGIPATGQPVPAKNALTRMTYEIPVVVTEHAAGSTHIIIRSCDEKLGTVRNITGESGEDISVSAGTEIQPEAFPAGGCEFVRWEDQYGRVLSTEPAFKFIPAENTTITAIFQKKAYQVKAGELVLETAETQDGNLLITGIESGTGVLDLTNITGVPQDMKLLGFAPGALSGNTAITGVALPREDLLFGLQMSAALTGDGTQNAALTPMSEIKGQGEWTLTLTATTDGSSFNQWGSGLLATGDNALGTSYPGGFQFYLAKAGTIVMKVNGAGETKFTTNVGSRFTLTLTNVKGNLTVTLTPENGEPETKTFENIPLKDIALLSTALPQGVNIEQLMVSSTLTADQTFTGCSALEEFTVAEGNTSFSVKDGCLYTADGTRMLVFPEGRLCTRYFRLRDLDDHLAYAAPQADAKGQMTAPAAVQAAATPAAPATLWRLAPVTGTDKFRVEHANSRSALAAKATGNNRVELATQATAYGEYTYGGGISVDNDYVLVLKNGDQSVMSTEGALVFAESTTGLIVDEVKSIPVTIDEKLWAGICLPVAVEVPDADVATVYTATAVAKGNILCLAALDEGTVIPAGTGVLVCAKAAGTLPFTISYAEAPTLSGNLLSGALLERTGLDASTCYTLTEQNGASGLGISTATGVDANTAYLGTSALSAPADPFLQLDITNGISSVGADALTSGRWYDLNGRPVQRPAKGVYLDAKGSKVLVK